MIECRICHQQCDDNDMFCRSCGMQLADDATIDQAIDQLQKKYFWNRRRKRILVSTLSTLGVLLAIAVVVIAISAKTLADIKGGSSLNSTIATEAVEVFYYGTHVSGNNRFINNEKNLTFAAATELTGNEIIALAEENDYQYTTDLKGWMRPSDYAAMVNIRSGTYELDSTELSSYRTNGALANMMGVLNVTGGSNLKEAFYSVATTEIVDFEYINNQVVSIIKNEAGKEYFVYGFIEEGNGSKMNVFEIYSNMAVENGFLNEYAERDLGRSMTEVWFGITGRNPGQH